MITKQRLSVVIITNNGILLPDCLQSVSWADEIILLDSGNEDITLSIAQKYGAKVFRSHSWMGYGKQRQQAQSYASGDMIFMIDTDERVTPELRIAIKQVLDSPPKPNVVYSVDRINLFLGRFMRHSGWYPDRVIRLYPRTYRYNNLQVHESLDTGNAKIIKLSSHLQHLTCHNFSVFQKKQLVYAETWAKQCHQKGKSCNILSVFSHAIWAFFRTLLLRAGFLDGWRGWILAVVNAQYTFNKYAMLWELDQLDKEIKCDNTSYLSRNF